MIARMSRSPRDPLLGKAVLLAFVNLAFSVAGCGEGTSVRDGSALADAARDSSDGLSPSDPGPSPADQPALPVEAAADRLVPDVAMEMAPLDGVAIDTTPADVPFAAERAVLDTTTPVDGPAVERGPADGTSAVEALADTSDVQRLDGASDVYVDPVCASADSAGFFASCTACLDSGNCDSVTVGSRTRRACGCQAASDCPCGFTCGCYEIAPSIQVCSVCTR
jgi:hypothetical protein